MSKKTLRLTAKSSSYVYVNNSTGDYVSNSSTMFVGSASTSSNGAGTYRGYFCIEGLYDLVEKNRISKITGFSLTMKTYNSTSGYNDCEARIDYVGSTWKNDNATIWRFGEDVNATIELIEGNSTQLAFIDSATAINFKKLIQNIGEGEKAWFRVRKTSGMGAVIKDNLYIDIEYNDGPTWLLWHNNELVDAEPYVWSDTPMLYTYPDAAMTSNNSQGCTASVSSTYSSSFPAWKLFDLDSTTRWASSSTATGPWVQLIMPRALYNIEVTMTNNNSGNIYGPTEGVIYGSNDNGTTLVQIGSYSGRNGGQAGLSTTVVCDNSDVAYNTVRLKITKWNSSTQANLSEVSISGYDVPEGGGWAEAIGFPHNGNGWGYNT